MQIFKDRHNREWTIAVHVGSIKRVKAALSIDLTEAVDGDLIARLINEPITLVNVLWALCSDQATQKGISEESFGEAMAGEAIDRATQALLGEIVDFFPLHRRQALAAAIKKQTELMEKGTAMILAKINDPALETKILGRLQRDMESAIAGA